jgi:glycosyltransferase involved in cell wall biosynthesis
MARAARVLVTTYDRLDHLRLALRGYLRQTTRDFALTVADDGSGPETAAIVAAFARTAPFPVAHVRWDHEGFRRAAILNEAVRRSEGEPLLVFTDGDCVPPSAFVERHVAAHGPRTFAVAGCVALDPASTEALTEDDVDEGIHETLGTDEERRALRRRGARTAWRARLRRPGHPRVIGLNVGIDRGLFEDLNGFDEAFVGYGHEDLDLRDRAMAARPRARVRVLWGRNDTVHLWHAPHPGAAARANEPYYRSDRPVRCARGLRPLETAAR